MIFSFEHHLKLNVSLASRSFLSFAITLAFPWHLKKTVGPASVLTFAGIELDTVDSEARLPLDKLHNCIDLLHTFLLKKKATLLDLQSPTGKLNFACSVIVPGRAFLHRLIDLSMGLTHPKHFVRLTREVKADIGIWHQFLQQFNGRSFFLEEVWEDSDSLQLFTDSSGALGFGAIFGSHVAEGMATQKYCYFRVLSNSVEFILIGTIYAQQMHNILYG